MKFDHMPGPIAAAAAQWEAKAIEKCRNDPLFKELNLCPVCVMGLPNCLCTKKRWRKPEVLEQIVVDSSSWTGR